MLSVLRSFWLYILTLLGKRNKIRRSKSISSTVLTVPASPPQAPVSQQISQSPAPASIPIQPPTDSPPVDTNPDDIPLSLLLSQAKAKRLAKKRKTGAPKYSKYSDAVVNNWNSLGGQSMSNIFLSTAQMMSGSGPSYTEAPLDVPYIQRPMEITVSPENGPSIILYRDPNCRPSDLESGTTSTFKPSAFSIHALSATARFLADPSCPTGRSTLLPQSTPAMPSVRRPIVGDDAKDRCSPYTDFFDLDMYARPISVDRPISVESCYSTASNASEERAEQIRRSESSKRVSLGPLTPATNRESIKLGISELKVACEDLSLLSQNELIGMLGL